MMQHDCRIQEFVRVTGCAINFWRRIGGKYAPSSEHPFKCEYRKPWQRNFAIFCQTGQACTMNISLPETLKSFVDEQVGQRGYGTSSEYVRELIRKDYDQRHLRNLLLKGVASSKSAAPVDRAYFAALRERVRSDTKPKARG
jgi:antitoxin ParD1/3/4